MKAFFLALLAVVLVHQYLRWAAGGPPDRRRPYAARVDFPTSDNLDEFLVDCTSEAPWVQYQDAMRRTRRPYRGHKLG